MTVLSDIAQRRATALANDDPEYRARRAEVIEAAAHVFRRVGYRAAKLDDVAAAIGKDRASLYYYISSKEELFQEVVAEAALENVLLVERLQKESIPASEKVATLIISLMASYERHHPYLFVYVQEAMISDGRKPWDRKMHDIARRFDASVLAIVQAGIEEGSFSASLSEAKLIAKGIIGMCNWSHRWYHPGGDVSAEKVGEVFASLALGGLLKR